MTCTGLHPSSGEGAELLLSTSLNLRLVYIIPETVEYNSKQYKYTCLYSRLQKSRNRRSRVAPAAMGAVAVVPNWKAMVVLLLARGSGCCSYYSICSRWNFDFSILFLNKIVCTSLFRQIRNFGKNKWNRFLHICFYCVRRVIIQIFFDDSFFAQQYSGCSKSK